MSDSHVPPEVLARFKNAQKAAWAHFAPIEVFTTPAAAQLVKHARVHAGQRVLDVACGTGVVAVTAARRGAKVSGLDLTPELLEHARANAGTAEVDVDFHQGDAEQLPFADAEFDVVLSQFGHIFAPRPAVAMAEMLRVLKPGGTVAFATWPPELYTGRLFGLVGSYLPPPPPGVMPPALWGDPNIVRERLGGAVRDVVFTYGRMLTTVLSPQHTVAATERTVGPLRTLSDSLQSTDPARLAQLRREISELVAEYFEDNSVKQDYLLTRATKI